MVYQNSGANPDFSLSTRNSAFLVYVKKEKGTTKLSTKESKMDDRI